MELDCVVFNMQRLGIMLVLLLALATIIDAARNEARTPKGNFVEARGCLGQSQSCSQDQVRQVLKTVLFVKNHSLYYNYYFLFQLNATFLKLLFSLKVTVPLLFIQIPVISRLLINMGDAHTIPQ